jgi:hypothetical protein
MTQLNFKLPEAVRLAWVSDGVRNLRQPIRPSEREDSHSPSSLYSSKLRISISRPSPQPVQCHKTRPRSILAPSLYR